MICSFGIFSYLKFIWFLLLVIRDFITYHLCTTNLMVALRLPSI
jgi:hypothetical protein